MVNMEEIRPSIGEEGYDKLNRDKEYEDVNVYDQIQH